MNCILFWNFRPIERKVDISQYSADGMVTKGVCHGQSPGAASKQEDVVGAAEVYSYTSAAPTMSSVRGAG